jgi:hypothetical protein
MQISAYPFDKRVIEILARQIARRQAKEASCTARGMVVTLIQCSSRSCF